MATEARLRALRFRLGLAYGLAASNAVGWATCLSLLLATRKEVDEVRAEMKCLKMWCKNKLEIILTTR